MNKEQWEELKILYGNLAYVMVQVYCLQEWDDFDANYEVDQFFSDRIELGRSDESDLRIKESAALPFDKKAAEKGDVVEYLHPVKGWKIFQEIYSDDPESCDKFFMTTELKLRMQHPRRAGVYYGD